MSESREHKRAKKQAAGKSGKTEVSLKGGRRLDAENATTVTEVQRNTERKDIAKAKKRLLQRPRKSKDLLVPSKDVSKVQKQVGKSIKVKPIRPVTKK